eukprot:COSAG04_NODE_17978_length_454_cov_0.915493_1_plen_130_part_10
MAWLFRHLILGKGETAVLARRAASEQPGVLTFAFCRKSETASEGDLGELVVVNLSRQRPTSLSLTWGGGKLPRKEWVLTGSVERGGTGMRINGIKPGWQASTAGTVGSAFPPRMAAANSTVDVGPANILF